MVEAPSLVLTDERQEHSRCQPWEELLFSEGMWMFISLVAQCAAWRRTLKGSQDGCGTALRVEEVRSEKCLGLKSHNSQPTVFWEVLLPEKDLSQKEATSEPEFFFN